MSDDSDANNNFVVASEVMSSAIRILSLLDLDDQQIAELFIAESGEGTALDLAIPAVDDDEEDITDARPWRLGTLAENESFSKEIDRFAKRVSALRTDKEPRPGEVQKLADLCLGVIPAFAAAQRWYREQCSEHGLEFAFCRDEWRSDEIEASLDRSRAQQGSSTIRRLNQSLLQTVLAALTYEEADYCLNLGVDGMQR